MILDHFKAKLNDIPLWQKQIGVVSIPLLILAISLVLTAWHERVARDAQGWVRHSLEVKASIFQILSLVTDAETGVRGYLLWDQSVYLHPYNDTRAKLGPAISDLLLLLKDNPTQTSLSKTLRTQAYLKMDLLEAMMHDRAEGTNPHSPLISQSRQAMEDTRTTLNALKSREEVLLTSRIAEYDAARRALNITLGILLITAILAGVTASYVVSASVLSRVNNLESYARRVSLGQPAILLDSGADELGSLGHCVQVMTNNLLLREEALREARSLLESANGSLAVQLQETRSANRELEAFSYSVSHDLRAPLRHVAGFSELMLKNSESLDPKNQRYLNIISSSIRQMGVLIDDLLAFSRMGRTALKSDPVDLNQTLNNVITDLGPEMQDHHIQWNVSPLPTVLGDKGTIRLVLQNLLANALKYSRTRNPAIITIEVDQPPEANMTQITVSDNGVGFDMAYHDKLFGVFQRLHNSEDYEGTGIGLATVRRIVQRHGGDVTAYGEIDKGARFTFTLPIEGKQHGN